MYVLTNPANNVVALSSVAPITADTTNNVFTNGNAVIHDPAPSSGAVVTQIADFPMESQSDYRMVNGSPVRITPDSKLPGVIASKTAQIIDAAQNALAQVVAGYPDLEVATWPQQYAESLAYTANPSTAQPPMLTAIAGASGQTVAAVAAVVMVKASAYQAASGAAVGRRIALLNQVAACTTTAQVQAINW